jgi:hypothetical protein
VSNTQKKLFWIFGIFAVGYLCGIGATLFILQNAEIIAMDSRGIARGR